MGLLERVARAHTEHSAVIVFTAIVLTLVLGLGVFSIDLQTDIKKEIPQDLPVIKLWNRVSDELGGGDTLIILAEIDKNCDMKNAPVDIRDPRVVASLYDIQETLEKEDIVTGTRSIASFFGSRQRIPETTEGVATILSMAPGAGNLMDKDYTATMILVNTQIGSSEEQISRAVEKIRRDIDSVEKPACMDITLTGTPPIRRVIMHILRHDLVYTMAIAGAIILALLVVIQRSITKSLLVFTPLVTGLVWTLGVMGWSGMKLSIATAGIGAMIFGLGTEYGVFMLERYLEERRKGIEPDSAMVTALPSVGSGIIGSGTTTMVGFLALLTSIMPMIRELGLTLALGIFSIMAATILVAPSLILMIDKRRTLVGNKKKEKNNKKNVLGTYSRILTRMPVLVIALGLAFTILAGWGAGLVETKGMEYSKMLPDTVREIRAMNRISDEFPTTGQETMMVVWTHPSTPGSDEARSIDDPRVLEYIDVLEQKAGRVHGVMGTRSIASILKQENNGRLPASQSLARSLVSSMPGVETMVNRERTMTVISLSLGDLTREQRTELVEDVENILRETPPPPGVRAGATGEVFQTLELRRQVGPTMRTTSNISMLGILVIVCVLFWSVRRGLISLLAIVFGTIWVYGLMGLLGMSISTEMAGGLSMIMGIGIDFGIQVVNRFRQELPRGIETAMLTTLNGTVPQMLVTTLAALIGFRAMSLGELTMLSDLGNMMSLGVLTCFLAAITIVPGVLALTERRTKKKRNIKERGAKRK